MRTTMLLTTSFATLAIAATSAHAQQAATAAPDQQANSSQPTQASEPGSEETTEVVVTGFRQTYANEIATKRREVSITDGISSDDLGRIPDLNIGEAIQRIPGVQLSREAEGRDATVSFRGLPGEYAKVTLNGVAFAEPILQTSSPLGAFLSDIFSGVRVDKSPLADAQSGGLSGILDLQIQGALARKNGIRVKAAYDWNELGDRPEPNFTVGINQHIGENFAVFGTVAYKRENFRRDSLLMTYGTLTSALVGPTFLSRYADYYAPAGTCTTTYASVVGCVAVAGGTGAKAQTGVQYPNQNRQLIRYTGGDQLSTSGGAEWQATPELKLGVTGLYTKRDQNQNGLHFLTLNHSGTGAVINPTSAPQAGAGGTYFVSAFDFSGSGNVQDSRTFDTIQEAWGVNPQVTYKDDKTTLTSTFTFSKAFNQIDERQFTFSRVQVAGGNGLTGSYYTGEDNFKDAKLVLNPNPFLNYDGNPTWMWGGPGNEANNYYDSPVGTPGRTSFSVGGIFSNARTTIKAA